MPDESLADFISGDPPAAQDSAAQNQAAQEGAGEGQPDAAPGQADGPAAAAGAPFPGPAWREAFSFDARSPMPEFDTSFAKAYAATHAGIASGDAVALVGIGAMPFRFEFAASLRGADQLNMLQVLDFGPVRDPETGRPVPGICYVRPGGNALVARTDVPFPPLREDLIIRDVVAPVTEALSELKQRRVFHGRINPANLIRRDGPQGKVVVGDAVAGPPGYDQPPAFETIERSMADRIGRGPGTSSDDLYALGVTIVVLCLGIDPFAEQPLEAILESKLERGSYSALVGQNRLPQRLLEPVRGLLTDDTDARWTIADLDLWLSGRRLSPKQATTPLRAGRPLRIGANTYQTVRSLAHGITQDVPSASPCIGDGSVNNWLRRTIGDEHLADDVEAVVAHSNSRAFRDERRAARVAMILDPLGPIRYRGRSFLPEGIGWAMAEALDRGEPFNEIADFIESGLASAWYQTRYEAGTEKSRKSKLFEQQRSLLAETSLGFGIERCLYDLNPDLPCQSPLLDDYYVLDLPGLIRALDEIAGRAERPQEPLDRHIAAFILSRTTRIAINPFKVLSRPGDASGRAMALLILFSNLQVQTGQRHLNHLAAWMVSQLEPMLAEYRSQRLRSSLKERLVSCAAQGNMTQMLQAVHSPKILAGDKSAFAAARREYAINDKIVRIKAMELENSRRIAEHLGHQYAAVTSGLLAVVALATVVLHRVI